MPGFFPPISLLNISVYRLQPRLFIDSGSNLRSIYHPERRDYDVAKMGFKTGAGKP
jgi:hypothetical protein